MDAQHLQAVDQDFAIQINQITQSLQDFGSKIAKAVSEATEKIMTLEVRTYTADNLNTITVKDTGDAELRAFTHVDFDGDMRVYVPTIGAGWIRSCGRSTARWCAKRRSTARSS